MGRDDTDTARPKVAARDVSGCDGTKRERSPDPARSHPGLGSAELVLSKARFGGEQTAEGLVPPGHGGTPKATTAAIQESAEGNSAAEVDAEKERG